jgi:hypothetical protein
MNLTQKSVLAMLALGSAFAAPAFAEDDKSLTEEVKTAVYELLDKDMISVKFDTNSSTLSDGERASLKALVEKLRNEKDVEKFIVAAWSDKDYPNGANEKLTNAEEKLAEKRKEAVQAALKDFGVDNVDAYSMAERPSWLAKVFNAPAAKIKGEGRTIGDKDAEDVMIEQLGQRLRAKGGPGMAVVIAKRDADATAH